MGATLNPTAAEEHVPEIECSNCVVKECVCSIRCTMPYEHIPLLMLEELANIAAYLLVHMPKLMRRAVMTCKKGHLVPYPLDPSAVYKDHTIFDPTYRQGNHKT
eukprot:8479240-Ditylum_brightwellii.AAC.1